MTIIELTEDQVIALNHVLSSLNGIGNADSNVKAKNYFRANRTKAINDLKSVYEVIKGIYDKISN
jgi:hypothetical protein